QRLSPELSSTSTGPNSPPALQPITEGQEVTNLLAREAPPNKPRSGDTLPDAGFIRPVNSNPSEQECRRYDSFRAYGAHVAFSHEDPPADAGGWQNAAAPRLNSDALHATIPTRQVLEQTVEREAPREPKVSPAPTVITLMPTIPAVMFNYTPHVPDVHVD